MSYTTESRMRIWRAALALLLAVGSVSGVATGQAPVDAAGASTSSELDKVDFGHTFISAPRTLAEVLAGGAPKTLAELRAMEQLQQEVAERAKLCTVNVAIGQAQGSGVVVSAAGLVLTAAHVAMRPGLRAELTFDDGHSVRAETLGMNRSVDAGMLRIVDEPPSEEGWPYASIGDSTRLPRGTWSLAAGHPGGYLEDRGVVVRVGRILDSDDEALVSDCALIGGDSGGPLFDLSGKLIAVHSRIGNDVADNIHVPINQFLASKQRMIEGESWGFLPGFRPVIGVSGTTDGEEAALTIVREGSAAARAGLEVGDVITSFGGIEITDFASLKAAVDSTMPGQRVRVRFQRDGRRQRTVLIVDRADGD